MLLFHHLELLPVIIGQISTCTSPDRTQMAAIVALIAGVLLFGGASIVAISAVATIMVQQILAGASLMAIATSDRHRYADNRYIRQYSFRDSRRN